MANLKDKGYELLTDFALKSDATRQAQVIRRQGGKARVVAIHSGWQLWGKDLSPISRYAAVGGDDGGS